MDIKIASTDESINKCFEVMQALRPGLKRETFVEIIRGMMQRGYHLIYIEEEGKATCASGYRFTEHLAWGRVIYIDDLTTLPSARGKGYASELLDHIYLLAKGAGCQQVHLDSGCNPERYDAHRLYLKKGYNITSHHFACKIKKDEW
jgi:GNAT superfamily N-acetyltransferase